MQHYPYYWLGAKEKAEKLSEKRKKEKRKCSFIQCIKDTLSIFII